MPRKSQGNEDGISVDDLALPKSMVQRLAKGVLPANSQIQKDAVAALSKSATVFVNYITQEANERAMSDNRKAIQPAHVFEALKELEFELFVPRCRDELQKYNSIQCEKRNSYRAKVRQGQREKGADGDISMASVTNLNDTELGNGERDDSKGPATKKARRSSGGAAAKGEDVDMDDDAEEEEEDGADEDVEDDDDDDIEGEGDEEAGAAKDEAGEDEADEDMHKPGFEDQDEDSAEEE